MKAYVLLLVLITNLVNCEDLCENGECSCEYDNTSITAKCSFLTDSPKNLTLPDDIVSLDWSENNLTDIEPVTSTTLKELWLNKNALKYINTNTFNVPQLQMLDLSDNMLENLNPDIFINMSKLEVLHLANNKFSIKSQLNFSYLVNLRSINLDNNFVGPDIELRSLFKPTGYGLPETINAISVKGVHLTDLPYNFFTPADKSLKELTISNNSLTKLFKLPSALKYLDISYNPIKKLNSSDFPEDEPLMYLGVLKMNGLEITEVPKGIFSNLLLYELELENNKNLIEFSNLTFGKQILRDSYDFMVKNLTLKGCNLTSLDQGLSVLFNKVDRLDLQNNPWYCDCNLAWVRKLSIPNDLNENLR